MVAVIDPAKYIASEVIFYALVDLIRQKTHSVITDKDYDQAAEFFSCGDYIPWCHLAGIEPEFVLDYAFDLAVKYRAWAEHPFLYKRPHIEIKPEKWRI
jgi:hypothetical protein